MKMLSRKYLKYGIRKASLRAKTVIADISGYLDYLSFVKEINLFAKKNGMIKTKYHNPSGATSRSRTCPSDLLRLGEYAASNPEIIRMWTCPYKLVRIMGPEERLLRCENIVLKDGKPIMGDHLIGGKSGSWGDYNKAHLFLCDLMEKRILFSVLAKDTYSFSHIYEIGLELCHFAEKKDLDYDALKVLESSGGGYVGEDADTFEPLFRYNENDTFLPASTTKVVTALVAMRINKKMDGYVKLHLLDICDGSGSEFFVGDEINFLDALYVMMLESSNTMANAIARTCGNMLRKRDRKEVKLKL